MAAVITRFTNNTSLYISNPKWSGLQLIKYITNLIQVLKYNEYAVCTTRVKNYTTTEIKNNLRNRLNLEVTKYMEANS